MKRPFDNGAAIGFRRGMKQLSGDGPPGDDIRSDIGQKYRDRITQKAWVMTRDGWRKLTALHVEPLPSEKERWNKAARAAGLNLEEWVCRSLNRAAERDL